MPGDHTRFSFDPFDDHIGVRMQQGRVMLDADFNELVEIRDRRSRAGTLDTIGRAAVPAETPHGFEILIGGASVTIGVGRLYVDGQLAENHGLPPREWEPHLAEERGTLPVPYEQQPYFPNVAVEAPFPAAGGPHLVYLDVWQRELTHLEDPELLEKALGVDTATRLQTVWQVKVLEDVSATCATPDGQIPAWVAATAPSAGRLTTAAVGVPSSNDPCVVNPTGGYRGTENRLYRVEVHTPGPLGAATFKWSRDNGSVGAAVTAINAGRDRLTVSRTRRDAVLRFAPNDWVEVTDDWLELAGRPGVMAKVLTVDDVAQTLTLTAPLPAGVFDLAAPAGRHTRVRRWDQKGLVLDAANTVVADVDAGGGEIHVNAAPAMVLEDGIQVTFGVSPVGGSFKVGDFWVFAARTVDASVEILTQAPPRGIHHHYARLAMVTFPATVEDCRDPWPPDFGRSCCTRVVRPGESIQAAIDSLPAAGGCVCLKVGVHEIQDTIRIARSNVHFHGESSGAVVRSGELITLLRIGDGERRVTDVVVESLGFELLAAGDNVGALIEVLRAAEVTIADCRAECRESRAVSGVRLVNAQRVVLERLELAGVEIGVWAQERARLIEVLDCRLANPIFRQDPPGLCGIFLEDLADAPPLPGSRVEGNHVAGFLRGIALNANLFSGPPLSLAQGTLITRNQISRARIEAPADAPKLWGIDVAAQGCLVQGNVLLYEGSAYGGIRMSGDLGRVEQNLLQAAARDAAGGALPLAILVGHEEGAAVGFGDGAVVAGNRVIGPQDGVLVMGASAVEIAGNEIGDPQRGVRLAVALLRANAATVAGNRVHGAGFGALLLQGARNRVVDNRLLDCVAGIAANTETDLEVRGNLVENVELPGFLGWGALGITRLVDNRFLRCAYQAPPAFSAAVWVTSLALSPQTEVVVDSCEIRDAGVSPAGVPLAQPVGGIFLWSVAASVRGNRIHATDPLKVDPNLEHRAIRLAGTVANLEAQIAFGSALVVDNRVIGAGLSALIEVQRVPLGGQFALAFDRVTFSHNVCEHVSTAANDLRATVSLAGLRMAVVGNHVKATNRDYFSFDLHQVASTFLGNVHAGPVLQGAAAEPPNPNANAFNILG